MGMGTGVPSKIGYAVNRTELQLRTATNETKRWYGTETMRTETMRNETKRATNELDPRMNTNTSLKLCGYRLYQCASLHEEETVVTLRGPRRTGGDQLAKPKEETGSLQSFEIQERCSQYDKFVQTRTYFEGWIMSQINQRNLINRRL
ncbi:uncharacterized protein LOC117236385 [Bombus vosnesenskii]|uniref:Uncharacterized protein LOC117236385 n=2 Tax=Pyrobombus TaxID=144703 RepID=A0A6J3KSU2_9HYME|nr:uncharacterized protein LOC112212890 [Bombus impatiens]XP_033355176.1 uncharacterized protein LOC117236385 [Bombus vosnesenskii]